MIKDTFSSLRPAIRYILKDKINLLFTMIPLSIGSIIYFLMGKWMYGSVLGKGREIIQEKISQGGLGDFLYYIIMAIMTVVLFFVINWTFVLVVSIISSPFNDLISSRIEKIEKGEIPETLAQGFSKMFAKILFTILNETKKVIVIGFFTLFAIVLSFFPVLMPVSFIISAMLLSAQFVDYSWSRHDMKLGACFNDIRRNFFPYLAVGSIFILMVSIPIVNLVVPPLATSFYTILWIKRQK
jgi:CysZ protein